jgi:hypothetical protein
MEFTMSEPQLVAQFHRQSAACQYEQLAVLRRHDLALGGPMGQLITLIELTGSVAAAVLEADPMAQPQVDQLLGQLALYVANAVGTRQ